MFSLNTTRITSISTITHKQERAIIAELFEAYEIRWMIIKWFWIKPKVTGVYEPADWGFNN